MRLIDADTLKGKVLEWMPSDPCGIEEKEFPFETDIVASLMIEIEEAPTIEPKQGEWIEDYNNTYSRCRMKCSACGKFSGIGGIKSNQRKPYCPNCGARMKGIDDETDCR